MNPSTQAAANPTIQQSNNPSIHPETAADLSPLLTDVQASLASIKTLQDQTTQNTDQLTDLRRMLALQRFTTTGSRTPGQVSDDCAAFIAASVVLSLEKSGSLESFSSIPAHRDALVAFSRNQLGITARTALNTSDIPLPTQYGSQIRELISEFGIARRLMLHYPIGMGTAKPARMGTRPAFASIAMSAAVPEKSPTISYAALESHKFGGLVRLPRELDEQSIVSMGHFLARYGAIEFARMEDLTGFMADGSGTYDSIKGIVQVAREANRLITLASGKTKPSDATLDDFRLLRSKVAKAALNGRLSAYYLDSTWETKLPGFRTTAEPNVYQRLPNGSAVLDGYPIIWTDVLEPYATAAAADKPIAVFGALSFWWFGEHGSPRIDTSGHVFFANDQLAVRFLEEIDFDYCAPDATAALLTAAS